MNIIKKILEKRRIANLPTIKDFTEIKPVITEFINHDLNQYCKYYLLLSDHHSYIFHRRLPGNFYTVMTETILEDELIHQLVELGEVKLVQKTEKNILEIELIDSIYKNLESYKFIPCITNTKQVL